MAITATQQTSTTKQVVIDAANRAAECAAEGARTVVDDMAGLFKAFGNIIGSMWTRGIPATSSAIERGSKPVPSDLGAFLLKARECEQTPVEIMQQATVLYYRLTGGTIDVSRLSECKKDVCSVASKLCDDMVSNGGCTSDKSYKRALERIAAAAFNAMRS